MVFESTPSLRVRTALDAQGGVFGARMAVALVNDGPVTLIVDA